MSCMTDYSQFYQDGKLKLKKSACTNLMNQCFEYVKRNELMSPMDDKKILEERKDKAENNLKRIRGAS